MRHLAAILFAALILTTTTSAHAEPKGGSGTAPAKSEQTPNVLSIDSDRAQLVPCGRNYYPHLYDGSHTTAQPPGASLSAGEVTAITLAALAVLATALVLVSSRTRRPRRGRTTAPAAGS